MGSLEQVSLIFVAEFDIDKGSSLSFQYPRVSNHDPNLLAELMLPDGAHLRDEDWTFFFLKNDTNNAAVNKRLQDNNYPPLLLSDHSIPKAQIQVFGFDFNFTSFSWQGFITPRVTIVLDECDVSLYSSDGSSLLLKITYSTNIEYHKFEPLCLTLGFKDRTIGLRFETTDDEIIFLKYLENFSLCIPRFNPDKHPVVSLPNPNETFQTLYTLNLVRTKHIPGAKRGARVKAMAVASRHQWVHVFKPLLVLALDRFFETPVEAILCNLFNAINSVDLNNIPRLSLLERKIFRAFEDKSTFAKRKNSTVTNNVPTMTSGQGIDLECIAPPSSVPKRFVRSAIKHKDGMFGVSKSPKDKQFYETKIDYDGVKVPVRIPLAVYPDEIGDFSVIKLVTKFTAQITMSSTQSSETNTSGNSNSLINNSGSPNINSNSNTAQLRWRQGAPYFWHPHLDTGPNTPQLAILINAILTNKRVIFLGHGRPSGEVANFVLAACAITSGGGTIFCGITERCFPYIGLTSVDDLLKVPGFIAGVTNPIFEVQTGWWDILCDINTGTISISPKIEQPQAVPRDSMSAAISSYSSKPLLHQGTWEGDSEIVMELISAINSHIAETYIRQKLYDHVQRIIDGSELMEQEGGNSANFEKGRFFFVDEQARKREILFLRNRIDGWRETSSFWSYKEESQRKFQKSVLRQLDVRTTLSKLRYSPFLGTNDVIKTFLRLQDVLGVGTDDQITEFLSYLPQSSGGLLHFASGLFHPRWEVRRATTKVIARIEWHKIGNRFVTHLNPFLKSAYEKCCAEFLSHDDILVELGLVFPQIPTLQQQQQMLLQQQQQQQHLSYSGSNSSTNLQQQQHNPSDANVLSPNMKNEGYDPWLPNGSNNNSTNSTPQPKHAEPDVQNTFGSPLLANILKPKSSISKNGEEEQVNDGSEKSGGIFHWMKRQNSQSSKESRELKESASVGNLNKESSGSGKDDKMFKLRRKKSEGREVGKHAKEVPAQPSVSNAEVVRKMILAQQQKQSALTNKLTILSADKITMEDPLNPEFRALGAEFGRGGLVPPTQKPLPAITEPRSSKFISDTLFEGDDEVEKDREDVEDVEGEMMEQILSKNRRPSDVANTSITQSWKRSSQRMENQRRRRASLGWGAGRTSIESSEDVDPPLISPITPISPIINYSGVPNFQQHVYQHPHASGGIPNGADMEKFKNMLSQPNEKLMQLKSRLAGIKNRDDRI
ncbi:hypothetical protein HK098_002254 [Nowakowskiella sp. JEL0407]|nr:hypothetical protein HK098_002254 [Nowakowskiella sp. JEL0407]